MDTNPSADAVWRAEFIADLNKMRARLNLGEAFLVADTCPMHLGGMLNALKAPTRVMSHVNEVDTILMWLFSSTQLQEVDRYDHHYTRMLPVALYAFDTGLELPDRAYGLLPTAAPDLVRACAAAPTLNELGRKESNYPRELVKRIPDDFARLAADVNLNPIWHDVRSILEGTMNASFSDNGVQKRELRAALAGFTLGTIRGALAI